VFSKDKALTWLRTGREKLRDAASPFDRRLLAGLRGPRGRRWGIAVAVCVALYAVLGFLALPAFVQPRMEHILGEALHRELRAESLQFNPFAFSVRARGVRIADARAGEPPFAQGSDSTLLSAEELYANVSLISLLRGVPVFDSVRLVKPHLQLRRNEDRSYNVQDLIDEWRSKPKEDPTRFSLDDLEVVDGRIDFDDRFTGEKHAVTLLNLAVPFLSNRLDDAEIAVQPRLKAMVNGAPMEIQGETVPFHDSHQTVLRMKLDGLELAKYLDYIPLRLHFNASGAVDAELQLTLSTASGRLKSLKLSGIALAQNLELAQLSGDTIAAIPSLRIALESYDFLGNEMRIGHVDINQPRVNLMRYKDNRLNAVALSFAPLPAAPAVPGADKGEAKARQAEAPPRPPFRFHLGEGKLTGGTLRFKDIYNGRNYQLDLHDVLIEANKVGSGQRGDWRLSFASASKEQAQGGGKLAFAPFIMDGRIDLRRVQLKQWAPYYSELVTLEVREGTVDAQSHFEVGTDKPVRFSEGNYSLRNAQLGVKGERASLWRFPSLAINGVEIDAAKRVLAASEIAVDKGHGVIRRKRDGKLLLPELLVRHESQPEGPKWHRGLKKLGIRGFALDYEDETREKPVKVSATYIDIDASELSTDAGPPVQLSLKAMLNRTGTLSINGPYDVQSGNARLALEARGIDLVQFEPYWADAVNFGISRGVIGARGNLALSKAPEGQTRVAYKGHVRVGNIEARQHGTGEQLASWRSLFFRNVDLQTGPAKIGVERIILSDFYTRLVLRADGTLNFKNWRPPQEGATAEAPPKEAAPQAEDAAPSKVVDVGGIELRNGRVSFSDYFIKPNYSAELQQVTGTVSALKPEKPGEVEIRANLNGNAPVLVTGLINPLAKDIFLDLNASAQGIDLPALSPYSIKYAGYGIERGKLSFKVHYLLEDRQLSAENQLHLDQLSFGPRQSGEGGPDLPVNLAVALLQDRNGVIDVNLPISGSLDDPQFSLGGLIGRMFLNLVWKAVTSPFQLIGAMFGGGGNNAELSYALFEPGTSVPKDTAKEKFDKLATALEERPQLNLDIAGRVDPVADRDSLRRAALQRDLRAQKAQATGVPNTDNLTIAPDEYTKYLELAYKASSISKPRNFIGIPKALPPEEMEKLLLEGVTVGEEQMRVLANERALAAMNAIVAEGGPRDRIYLVSPKLDTEDIAEGSASRVDFALR
jgi:hypothetical protein